MGDIDVRYGPIFVVGMNGSGTTALLDHLNSHPKIFGFPDETRIIPYFLQKEQRKYSDAPASRQRLIKEVCSAFPFWKANGETPIPFPDNCETAPTNVAEIIDYVMGYFAAQEKKQIWCEKTPMHAVHIRQLANSFPKSRFIHIIRDGRDCAASFERRWNYNAEVSVFRWKNVVREARRQSRDLPANRYIEVRFERLTNSPKEVMRILSEFLGIEFSSHLLTSSRTTARVRGMESKTLKRNSGSYLSYFEASQLAKLEDICGSLLHELGYETANQSGDRNLSTAFVRLHQARTQFFRLGDIINRAKTSRKPLQLILSRIKSGLRQIHSNRL